MGTSTGQELVDNVNDHIGNRAEGQIGSRGVEEAILSSLNKGFKNIAKKISLSELQDETEVDIDDTANAYDKPTGTINTLSATIKNVITAVLLEDGETDGTIMEEVFLDTLDRIEPYKSSEHSGRPFLFSMFADQLILYPYPDTDYTLYLKCNMWPPALTLTATSPLNDEWDEVVEAYATYDIYAKLQQALDSQAWYKNYIALRRSTIGSLSKKPNVINDATCRDMWVKAQNISADYARDPYIRRSM